MDNTDFNLVTAAFGHAGTGLNEDVNGDNLANAADRTAALKGNRHLLNGGLAVDN